MSTAKFSDDFKRDAVYIRSFELGLSGLRSVCKSAIRRQNPHSLYACRRSGFVEVRLIAMGSVDEHAAELRLRLKLEPGRVLRTERDILKKATAYFARDRQSRSTAFGASRAVA